MEGKINIHSEKSVTVDELIVEARDIFKQIRSGASFNDVESSHRQFCISYPIVVRYMYETFTYHEKAFKLYLKGVVAKPHQSEDEYLESQAKYVSLLHRFENPRAGAKDIAAVRSNILKMLKTEHESFKSAAANAKENVEATETHMKEARADILKSLTDSMPQRDWIIVDTDLNVDATQTKSLELPTVDLDLDINASSLLD
jgi:hypothetical protein